MSSPFTKKQLATYRERLEGLIAELEAMDSLTEDSRKPVELDQTTQGRLSRMDALQVQAMQEATADRRRSEKMRAKAALDDAADTCNAIVDARRVMNRCRLAAEGGVDVGAEEETREGARKTEAIERGLRCLERYCWLLLFSAYCVDQASGGFATRFGAWTRARWASRPKARDMGGPLAGRDLGRAERALLEFHRRGAIQHGFAFSASRARAGDRSYRCARAHQFRPSSGDSRGAVATR